MGPPPPPAAGRPRPGPGPAPAPPPAGGRRGGAEPRGQCRPGRLRPRILGTFLTSWIPEPTAPGWGAGGGHGRPRGGARGGRPLPPGRPGGRWPAWSCFCNRVFFFNFFFFFKNKRPQSSFWRTRLVPVRVRGRASRGPPLGPQFSFFFLCPLPFHFYRFSDISRAVPQGGPAPPSVKFEFPGRGRGPCPGPLHPWVGGAVWGRGGRAAPAPGGFFSLYKSGAAAPWLSVHTEARPLRV